LEVGESASAGENVISMIGGGELKVVLQVPELDVSKIISGTLATVRLDALPGELFEGVVQTINVRETEIDGVPVYEAFVEIQPDERVRNGMTAYGEIEVSRRTDVLAVPSYLLENEGGEYYINVISPSGDAEKRKVAIGLRGSDNFVEITSGLSLGEVVVGKSEEQ